VNEAFPTPDWGDDPLDADRIPLTRRATQHHSPFVVGDPVAAAPVEGETRHQMRGNPSVAYKTCTLATKEVHRVARNAAVQPKAVAYPTDARLIHSLPQLSVYTVFSIPFGTVTAWSFRQDGTSAPRTPNRTRVRLSSN
jgi:hypothetical protein